MQEYEQEMTLRDFINIITKHKKTILTAFLISVILTTIVSFIIPKIYEISMIMEPGVLEVTDSGNTTFIDSTGNIKAKIEAGTFDLNVVKALELNPRKTKIKLKISQPKDSTFLKVSINEPESKKELGVKILNQFYSEVVNFYKNIVELKKDGIDKQIFIISNRIKSKNNAIKLNEENLKIVEAREKELIDELKGTKVNTEQLLVKRDVLLEKKVPTDDISSLLYSNTIQQNISYFNQLNNQLTVMKTRKEDIANAIKDLPNEINNFDTEIEKLKAVKENIRNINLIQEPRVSFEPIGLSRRRIVILVGILGLMLGTLLAFFMEFLEKSKKA
jgi:capsular polysaccharide biosynthesis protein